MMFDKKGITLVSTLIIIVVLSVLTGTITVSIDYILDDTYKKEFIREYKLVQAAVDDYVMRNSGVIDFEEFTFDISSVGSNNYSQFDGETIVNKTIETYIIDLDKIGVNNTTYGTNIDEDDVYLLSKDTNTVYYKKGFVDNNNIYYRDIED